MPFWLEAHGKISGCPCTAILTIDGAKATDIYKKYLGVEPDEYFVTNISEFPLVVERDGMYMGRTPSGYGENGEILLEADIHSGEKVTLSYAEHEEILIGTLDAASRMSAFGAERLSLVICGSRFTFLQDEYHLEMDYFNKGRETDGTLVLGLGEIYRYQGQGGILNSALVAVGMKEGLSDDISRTIVDNTPEEKEPELIPLSVRLSHFLRTMTEELEEAVNEAEAANQAKSIFLSNMSHEIRTPINAVLGMDEMILRETEEPQTMEYAQNIKAAGNTLLSLVNEILDFSKIEAGKLDIIPVDYDLSSVVNDLMNMIKPRAEAKELTLDFDIDPLLPSVLCGDEIRIKQVITNILTNAVKYTNEGSVKLSMTYDKISEDTANLKVSVKDTGIGIKREDMKNLFSPFQRVDEVKNRAVEGTGLGLDITVRLLELMGSRLEVSSNYGKGSEFSFNLKQKVVSWEPLGDYIEAYSRALSQKEKYKERFTAADAQILVVDDTPMNLAVFEGLLRKTMVNIDKAESGLECLNMTRQKKYDLIFLDYRMPNMDGVETLQHLKDDKENPNADTVVICLSANAVSGAREQYIEAGFDDYLTKPILADKLEGMMIRYLPEDKVKIKADDGQDEAVDLEKELKALPEWLKEGKILDINAGVENCGDAAGFLTAIEIFMEAAPDYLSDIEGFLKEEKIPDYTIKVHAVKSSARIIGAGELSLLAEKLEKAWDDKDLEFISQNTPQLLSMLGGLYESLSANMGKCSQEQDLPLIEEERLKEALDSIRELVPSFDYDGINYIVNALGEYSIPEEHRGLLEKLKGALRRADWDEIKELLG